MVQPELVAYVEKHLKKGIPINNIKKRLLDAGHKVIAVESAIAHVNHKRHLFRVLMVAGVIFVLMILGFVLQEQPETVRIALPPSEQLPESQNALDTGDENVESPRQTEIPAQAATSIYGLDTTTYDDRISAAIATKDPLICEKTIDRQDVREKCKELVQNE